MTDTSPAALSDFPRFDNFASVADPDVYAPVPGDWLIGLSDVAEPGDADTASYAMFSGGGIHRAENEVKSGRLSIDPAAEGDRPDLTGLSCRWTPIETDDGVILSLIARPTGDASLKHL